MSRLVLAVLVALAAAAPARPAQRAAPGAEGGARPNPVDAIVAGEREQWGVAAVSLADGRAVYAHNADALMQPASCMKLLTTAAALDALGPDWRTKTSVYATSDVSARGVVSGDLVLYGRGDPNLSNRFASSGDLLEPMRYLAASLAAKGVRRVEGGIVADESYLSGPPHGAGWGWADLQWYFGTEVSALSFNDNLARIVVTPGPSEGAPCSVRVEPDIGYVEVINQTTTTGGGGSDIAVHRSIDTPTVVVGGSLGARSGGWSGAVAVHRPARYAAAAFRRALADAGIEVAGPTTVLDAYSRRPDELELGELVELASLTSQPLSELIRVVNKRSQNLHAELILRALGRERGPADASSDQAGTAVVLDFARRAGADVSGAVVRDGSGLSRLDRVTPAMLEAVLAAMARHSHGAIFADSLPVGGVDGTLKGRLRGLAVSAKTGSLTTAKSLAGYLTARGGERLAFAIVYNDPIETGSAVSRVDRVARALAVGIP